MRQIIYASTASSRVTFETVLDIINVSDRKNKESDITGFLLYNGLFFLQCLEGDTLTLERTITKIKEDDRHNDIIFLGDREIHSRDFEMWNMGYVNDANEIKRVIFDEAKRIKFTPHRFTFDEALRIMKKLSYLV